MGAFGLTYTFLLPDSARHVVDLIFDEESMDLVKKPAEDPPSWTDLTHHQCPHCPLAVHAHAHCPAALSLTDIVQECRGLHSFDNVRVAVTTSRRVVSQDTTVQKAVSALIGLVLATCGCPHTSFFKPMACFHLPLASIEETSYRAASMYLLAQYFLRKKGHDTDLELNGLKTIYENLEIVNEHLARRLRSVVDDDAALNALTSLDVFTKTVPFDVEDSLQWMENLFCRYFVEGSQSV